MLYQKEYPQIWASSGILNAVSTLPQPPREPIKPTPVEDNPPDKYPRLKEYLTNAGISFILGLFFLLITIWNVFPLFVLFFIALFGATVYFLYKSFKSLMEYKTYEERINKHKEELTDNLKNTIIYEKEREAYLKEKEKYDQLISKFKTPADLNNYRIENRRKYLKEIKPKDGLRNFFNQNGPHNPKLGRAEYFFRNYIESANKKNFIPKDFEFYFDTSIELISYGSGKVSYYFPDIMVITPRGLLIDVEIDEPYTSDTKEPIHCIHSLEKSDFHRNEYFTKYDCNVLRFSERQIIKYPNICLQIILMFDDYARVPESLELPYDFKEKAWDETEAKRMASENYRDTY